MRNCSVKGDREAAMRFSDQKALGYENFGTQRDEKQASWQFYNGLCNTSKAGNKILIILQVSNICYSETKEQLSKCFLPLIHAPPSNKLLDGSAIFILTTSLFNLSGQVSFLFSNNLPLYLQQEAGFSAFLVGFLFIIVYPLNTTPAREDGAISHIVTSHGEVSNSSFRRGVYKKFISYEVSKTARTELDGGGKRKHVDGYSRGVTLKERRKLPSNCLECIFKYVDSGEFAGKVVLYEPYFKHFQDIGYPLENLVGDQGKTFLEEMTDIRLKNPEFTGETNLGLIQEWQESNREIKTQSTSIPFSVSPLSGGFRRHVTMDSIDIEKDEEIYWLNIKFVGQTEFKKILHTEDFEIAISLMEKYNELIFPPIMYIELQKGEYTVYGQSRIYDRYPPALLFFFMPDGKRIMDIDPVKHKISRISKEYVKTVALEQDLSFKKMVKKIATEPFRFLAHCHTEEYYLTGPGSGGTSAHYGNFFLSLNSGEIYQVCDIAEVSPKNKRIEKRLLIKLDISNLLFSRGGLYPVLLSLGICEEEIDRKYTPRALYTYLKTLYDCNAQEKHLFNNDLNSFLLTEDDIAALERVKQVQADLENRHQSNQQEEQSEESKDGGNIISEDAKKLERGIIHLFLKNNPYSVATTVIALQN
ncbi:MAG: hypothetical protein KAJ14_07010, partial [Candidatus Omnitrophica bacterium]|nr:hypothetical protein [Candidatus Omnitrophota bacterium]